MVIKKRVLSAVLGTLALGACDQGGTQGGTDGATTGEAEAEGDEGEQCEGAVSGQYANCMTDANGPQAVDLSVCGNGDAVCITDKPQLPTAGVCALDGCESACDCPPQPATGDAPVTCAEVVDGAGKQCHLDCADGQICPDGMFCYGGYICAWPKTDDGIPYGDCINNDAEKTCGPTQSCVLDNEDAPTYGVCAEMGCDDVSMCPQPPSSGNAVLTCAPLVDGAEFACYLDCSNGETCPDAMVCFEDRICTFQAGMPGGDDGDTDGDTGGTGG